MCTLDKRGDIFFLTITGDDKHRLNPNLIESLRSALCKAREQSTRGSALITTACGKFFSNGFDLAWVESAGSSSSPSSAAHDRLHHLINLFNTLIADLISLSMSTIAAMTGHTIGGGMMLMISHNYVLMRSDRGALYMSELDIGMVFPDNTSVLVRSKVGSAAERELMLKASKLRAEEAVAMGIVEEAHCSAEATMEAAVRLGEKLGKRKWNGEVYAEIRKGLYPELCGVLGLANKAAIASSRL
ncbi:Enoyl-CoA delta isomerase 3 [Camellia lanceoleosa]|uniref:Enoyl-CoA delta isomerase 3 n=1 Tax=Camellia lanceoleosa TaxID=1840588 RepID=A0ACC0HEC3_9ERIC|nr:Enoyl-CoA delta isomerase 3 [Camellia lanceoleosa]